MALIKIGVVGTGSMGGNYCRILHMMKNVDFVGVFDINFEKSNRLGRQYQVIPFSSYEDLLDAVDAVIIAVPTPIHFILSAQAIAKKKHALIEKPFVVSLKEAAQLKKLLEVHPVIVQAAHVERFNPIFKQLTKVIQEEKILSIEARRFGIPNRFMDSDVILDMMIHDIDIILQMVKSPIASVTADGTSLKPGGPLEIASALISFQNGIYATLVSNRMSQEKARTLYITETDRFIKGDMLKKELYVFRSNSTSNNPGYAYPMEYLLEKLNIPHADPLFDEIQHFVHSIESGSQSQVSIPEATLSLEVALKIKEYIKQLRGIG